MLAEELKDLVKTIQSCKAEMQHVEVKSANQGCPKRLYDTLSSFSNQEGGGVIVFGLDEEREFQAVGVYDAQDLQQKINEQCKQMQPVVRPLLTIVEMDGHILVAAEIPEIDIAEKPCYYQGAGRMRGSFVRVGEADEPMSDYEIYSFDAFRHKRQDDIRIVERAGISSLDANALLQYIGALKLKKPNLAQLADENILELLSITKNGTPTLSAVMVFSPFPQAYFPQFGITSVVVPGYEMGDLGEDGSRFHDNRRIEGNISNMLEEALLFVRKNMSVKTIVDEATGKRKDRPEYPINAVREAILNALIHRDYSIHTEGTPIQILFFRDRLEIRNPGGLYGRLSVSQLGKVRADTRNPVLANTLEVLNIVENRFSGIPTIYREMEAASLPAPVFCNERGNFVVKFYNDTANKISAASVENTSSDIVAYCATPRTRDEIASFLDLSTSHYAIQRYVLPLVEKGLLRMTIPEKPGSRNQRYVAIRQEK